MNVICPECKSYMTLNPSSGKLECGKCSFSFNIEDADMPAYGPKSRAAYIKEKADGNIFPANDADRLLITEQTFDGPVVSDSYISIEESRSLFRRWAGPALFTGRSFNSALKKSGNPSLCYIPVFRYITEASTTMNAVAEENEAASTHYYDIQHVATMQKVHNISAGEVSDIVIEGLSPFGTDSELIPSAEFDQSDSLECVTKDIGKAYEMVKGKIAEAGKKIVSESASGYSNIHNKTFETEILSHTQDVIYHPVYKLLINKKNQTETIYMNGQSGRIYGRSQTSMFRFILLWIILGLMLFAGFFFGKNASAKVTFKADGFNPIICDDADLLNEYDEIALYDRASALKSKTGFIYTFITTDSTKEYMKGKELESIYDDNQNEFLGEGAILFLISTDPDNPQCVVQGYNMAYLTFTHPVCDYITDQVKGYVSDGDYTTAISVLMDNYDGVADGTINDSTIPDEYVKKYEKADTKDIPLLLLAFAICLITAGIIMYIVFTVSTGKKTDIHPSVSDESSDKIIVRTYRLYVRTRK